jgi:hypothetical protein
MARHWRQFVASSRSRERYASFPEGCVLDATADDFSCNNREFRLLAKAS